MKSVIDIHKVMDSLDDGYHIKEMGDLVKISNELFECLSEVNKKYVELAVEEQFNKNHGIDSE